MIYTLLPLVGFGVLIALALRDAIRDKTPMRPWTYKRPDLAWWVTRRTVRERARVKIILSKEDA